jgi:Mg2+ and Co2+ transporter CorA
MVAEGHLLLVLHAPPGADEDERSGRFFWREPDGSWRASIRGSGVAAIADHLREFETRLDALEDRESNASLARDYFDLIRELTPLHRAARNLHAVIQKARESMNDDSRIIRWRDDAYSIERTAELLLGETRNGLDFVTAMRAEEQAVESQNMALAGHRLNVLAALFFPLATIASLLGMNVPTGLEDSPEPWTFIGVLVVGALVGVGLKGFLEPPAKT